MFVGCSEIIMFLLNMCNMLEFSGLFVCPGGLIKFFSAWGTEKVAGLWFARGINPGRHYEWKFWFFSTNSETNFLKNENLFFKKIENSFTVESTTFESVTYPCKTALNERSFASIYFIFLKVFFQYKKLLYRIDLKYQLPECPYSYFLKALEFHVRVLFPCEYP